MIGALALETGSWICRVIPTVLSVCPDLLHLLDEKQLPRLARDTTSATTIATRLWILAARASFRVVVDLSSFCMISHVCHAWGGQKEAQKERTPTPTLERLCHPLPKRHFLTSQQEIGESSHQVRPQEVRPTEPTIPPSTERSEPPQPDPGAQQSEDTGEDSDAIMEALDDRLAQIQGEVGLHDLSVGRLHGRVTAGKTRLAAVEQGVTVAGQ
ncbi:hypothetical protein L1987_18820 [Smallanthus sonchifolius]|uniref:Uncharacterized protein n=1 Tax=Smallanthus sonchifolius TaxID=185202 RepID=A0ACB9J2S7_9ASTR|nr:hypothetical protein L1987_18820 [Smallanthus sonchifolius]